MSLLSQLVAPLDRVLFHLGNDAVSYAELLGFVTGAICVFLTMRASIHNFWTGILNSAFFLVLFASARLWADSSLQVVYIVLGFIGWWQWLYGGQQRTALVVGRAGPGMILGCVALVVVATAGLSWVLTAARDIAPFFDALTTALSLAATWLLNLKKVETWAFWIAADLIYIPLYFVKGLDLTAIVYVLFLSMSAAGAWQWTRLYRAQQRERGRDGEPELEAVGR